MEYYDNGDRPGEETAAAPEKRPDVNQPNGTAIASMVCGILGLLLLCCCIAFPLSIILGVAAIVLAILSKKDSPFCGYAIAGLILGIFALLLGVVEFLYLMAVNMLVRDPSWAAVFDEIMEEYSNSGSFPVE